MNNPQSDLNSMQPDLEKPSTIIYAIILLWVSIAISLASVFYKMLLTPNVMVNTGAAIFSFVFTFVIFFVIIRLLESGKGWARIPYLILSVLSLLSFFVAILTSVRASLSGIDLVLGILNNGLAVVILYLLFCSKSSNWFKNLKLSKSGTP